MRFYPDLYIGDKVEHPEKILKKIKIPKKMPDLFVIALSQSPVDQLEIRSTKDLGKNYYASTDPVIVGIAEDYEDAVNVVKRIAEDCFLKRGDCRLKDFLSERI